MTRIDQVTAVVLAGGRSKRMGVDKALLPWRGTTLLRWVVGQMRALFPNVLVAGGDPARYPGLDAPIAPDLLPGGGAIVGIHAGLAAAADPRVFVVACDAPFASAALIRRLVAFAPHAAWTCPRTGAGPEPLFAVYHQTCLAPLRQLVEAGERRIRPLAELVETVWMEESELRACDPELRSFVNLNTPDDLAAAGGIDG